MSEAPLVSVVMGSKSDWSGVMEHVAHTLAEMGVAHECRVLSAHRTPAEVSRYASALAPQRTFDGRILIVEENVS